MNLGIAFQTRFMF